MSTTNTGSSQKQPKHVPDDWDDGDEDDENQLTADSKKVWEEA